MLRHFILTFAMAGLTTGLAAAQDLRDFGFTEGWNIMVDPQMGNGCLIQRIVSENSVVRIGYDATNTRGYVTVFDRKWGQIRSGQTYPVRFDLDGQSYEATATGFQLGNVPGAGIFFTDRAFLDDIAKKRVMSIYGQNGHVMDINLHGSANALKHARDCQAQQG